MKLRAESLDSSLDSLRKSLSSISQLTASLASLAPRTSLQRTSSPSTPDSPPKFIPTRHLPPLLSLPLILQCLINDSHVSTAASDGASEAPTLETYEPLIKSRELWGIWEPTIRAWEEAGVKGAEEVGRECREILRRERRSSNEHM
jgi:vacuolar protein sorting-associated protein 51